MTLSDLIAAYKTDADSPFKDLRYHSRQNYEYLMGRLEREHGDVAISAINARMTRQWHGEWSTGNKIAVAHGLIGMLRTLCSFGVTMIEDESCLRLSTLLSKLRFKMAKPRTERLTVEQVVMIRAKAHELGRPSIALAQSLQFEGTFRQRDIVGCWEPLSEPGPAHVIHRGWKWHRGLLWSEIDSDLILRHVTSKRQKMVEVDLKLAPMVLEELKHVPDARILAGGPVIISELDGLPWDHTEFRRWWRKIADACGIPRTVCNMDSRAGAISEALLAGAPIDSVRKAATHSNASMTAKYSRGDADATRDVMRTRVQSREAA